MFPFQVRALKQKIETEKGATDYSAPQQKLIYAGKILGKFILSWGIDRNPSQLLITKYYFDM